MSRYTPEQRAIRHEIIDSFMDVTLPLTIDKYESLPANQREIESYYSFAGLLLTNSLLNLVADCAKSNNANLGLVAREFLKSTIEMFIEAFGKELAIEFEVISPTPASATLQ